MKKLFYTLFAMASAAPVLAQSSVNPEVADGTVTGSTGVLNTVESLIKDVATGTWPVIGTIVGVGLLIWLGRAIIRAVRSYFSTAM